MNEKINLDLKTLKFVLSRNRVYIIPVVIILISIILFFQFVVPQFNSFLMARQKMAEASLKLETLKSNLNMLMNTNEEKLELQFNTFNSALPSTKDFTGILDAIYSTAQKTGVGLGNFSFKIGNLSQAEASESIPTIKLSLPVEGGVIAINSFVEAISKSSPLVKVNLVKIGDISSTVDLSFYYKPLNYSQYSQDSPVIPLSQKGQNLLNQLNQLETSFSPQQIQIPVASPSATPQ